MSSTDRSISAGISLPQWMKTRINDRFDLDHPTSVSPPSDNDGFFFIKYPRSENTELGSSHASHSETERSQSSGYGNLTVPSDEGNLKRCSTAPSAEYLRAMGNDDGYGKSPAIIVQDTVNDNTFGNYFPTSTYPVGGYQLNQRRNSKSLPASPLSSPKLRKRNPYFTAPFEKPDNGKSGWLMSFLTQRKSVEDLTSSTESHYSNNESGSRRVKNYGQYEKVAILKAEPKPSELREMNFWAPTSM